MPTVREYEAALQRNPADTEAFVALRKAYRQAQKHDKLVTLYETRAQAIEDGPKAAELFYLAAELRIDQLGDAEGAEADLANAVDRDPGHIRAAARLKDIYREQGRTADYMTMLEMEAAAVARTRDPARIAELQSEMGQLFVNHFARLERSVRNPQRPGKLDAEHVKSIESARKIYRALGDYRSVVRLYELELEGTTDAKRRADLLLGLGRVLGEKLEELDAAAQRLTEVIRLRPRDEKALELLAADLRQPQLDRRRRARSGRRPSTSRSRAAARRRATPTTPSRRCARRCRPCPDTPSRPSCSSASTTTRGGFQDLDRYYRERVQAATARDRAHRLPLQAGAARRGRAGRPGRGAAGLRRDRGARTAGRPGGGAAGRAVPGQPRLRQAGRAARAPAGRHRGSGRARPHHDRAGGAVPRPPGRSRSGGGLPARDPADRAREPGGAGRLRRSLPRQGRLGGAGRPAGVLVRAGPRRRRRARRSGGAAGGDRRRRREEPGRRRARARRLAAHRGARARPTRARARRSGASCSRPRAGTAWRRCWSARRRCRRIRRSAPRPCAGSRRSTARSWRPAPAVEIYKDILRAEPHDAVALRALVEIYETRGRLRWPGARAARADRVAPSKQERVSLLRRLLVIYDERLRTWRRGSGPPPRSCRRSPATATR